MCCSDVTQDVVITPDDEKTGQVPDPAERFEELLERCVA